MNVNPIEAKNSLTEYYKKTSLTDKSTATAGRARDTAADCSVGFAHGIICLVFESGDIWRFFFVGGAHATAGVRSSEIIGLRFSDDLFIFKTTYDYIFKYYSFNCKS